MQRTREQFYRPWCPRNLPLPEQFTVNGKTEDHDVMDVQQVVVTKSGTITMKIQELCNQKVPENRDGAGGNEVGRATPQYMTLTAQAMPMIMTALGAAGLLGPRPYWNTPAWRNLEKGDAPEDRNFSPYYVVNLESGGPPKKKKKLRIVQEDMTRAGRKRSFKATREDDDDESEREEEAEGTGGDE